MSDWDALMERLHRDPIPSRHEPDEERIKAFEEHIGVELPADYRLFLSKHGGVWVSVGVPIAEPTPFGPGTVIEAFYGFMEEEDRTEDLRWNSDLVEGAPVAIPIARGPFGGEFYLFTSDYEESNIKAGAVYFLDGENRSAWSDAYFYKQFPNLASDIKTYLELRRTNQLPEKPEDLSNYYHIADSFTEFLEACTPEDLDED